MSHFSELDLAVYFHRTWDKILLTVIGALLTYVIFCAAITVLVHVLRRSGSYRFRIRESVANADQVRREIVRSLSSLCIFEVATVTFAVIGMGFGKYIDLRYTSAPLWQIALAFPAILFLHDTYFYWTHRLMHLSAFYRTMHREHHKSSAPTAWAAYAFAFLEAWVQGSFIILYVLLLPANLALIVYFIAIEHTYTTLIHSGFDPFPRWMVAHRFFGWVAGSTYHDLHHRTFNWNFGLYFRFWDRLMGTEHPDFARIYAYVHSPRNDGNAYKLLRDVDEAAVTSEAPALAAS
jgi:Delta7-sterol 5-desaturase